MTYLDYIVLFNQRDQERSFSGNATRLYLKLLHLANSIGWPAEFAKPDPYVSAVCGFSGNTMKDCRTQLVERGLLAVMPGGSGRGAVTSYQLLGLKKVSNPDTLPAEKVANSDTLPSDMVSKPDTISPENGNKVSEKVSNFDTPIIDKEEGSSAASAAAPASTSPSQKPAGRQQKAKGATHEEIAALPLPFDGAEFAEAWRTFYTTNTKQAGKNISAFALMLKKLGKYPEAFAVLMIEKSIMGNWQGVENGGTARDFQEWQTEQARRPAPAAPTIAPSIAPELNEEFLAQQQAREEATRAELLARRTATA